MSDNIAVKFDRALATKAKFVAEAQGVSLASYLANVCRTTIDRDFDRAVEKLRGGEGK